MAVYSVIREMKIMTEEMRQRAGVANISENTREARLRWLGHVEKKKEECVVMTTWKMEVTVHRKTGRPQPRWSDVIYEHTLRTKE